jgi:mRNA interferase MazF
MKRGEIYLATLDPVLGSEVAKRRPVIIVSNDLHNRKAPVVTVVPLTSNVAKVYPFEVFVSQDASGLTKNSKAMPQQIRSISKQRITGNALGQLSDEIMVLIEAALKLHLDLES